METIEYFCERGYHGLSQIIFCRTLSKYSTSEFKTRRPLLSRRPEYSPYLTHERIAFCFFRKKKGCAFCGEIPLRKKDSASPFFLDSHPKQSVPNRHKLARDALQTRLPPPPFQHLTRAKAISHNVFLKLKFW